MIKLLASPKAVESQAEEVHRLVKVVDFEPPEVHLQLAYDAWTTHDGPMGGQGHGPPGHGPPLGC